MKTRKRATPARQAETEPSPLGILDGVPSMKQAQINPSELSIEDPQGLYPFGPQSRWSLLVDHREFLLDEIDRGRKCLEHLRNECSEFSVIAEWSPGCSHRPGQEEQAGVPRAAAVDDAMTAFLREWLQALERRLTAVETEIAGFVVGAEPEFHGLEESTIALLRAAG